MSLKMSTDTRSDSHRQSVKNWLRKHHRHTFRFHGVDERAIRLELDGGRFLITVPEKYPEEPLMIDTSMTPRLSFLTELNEWSITHFPTVEKLMSKISRLAKKINESSLTEKALELDASPDVEGQELYDADQLRQIRTEQKLLALIPTSKSTFNVDSSAADKAVKIFANSDQCGRAVVNELLMAQQSFKPTDGIEIELVDDNVFHWRVSLSQFRNPALMSALEELKRRHGRDAIVFELFFHDQRYPSYPVHVKCCWPKLGDSLMHRIPNMQIFKFEYWSPTRSSVKLITKLQEVMTNFGVIDLDTDLNDPTKNPKGAYFELDTHLMKLSSLFEDEASSYDPLDSETYPRVIVEPKKAATTTSSRKGPWAKGTGYGSSGSSTWDPAAYAKAQEEKNKQLMKVLQDIYAVVAEHPASGIEQVYRSLKSSYLVPLLKNRLGGASLMDIEKNPAVYKLLIQMITLFANEDGIHLFADTSSQDLFTVLKSLAEKHSSLGMLGETGGDTVEEENTATEVAIMASSIIEIIEPLYLSYVDVMVKKEAEMKKAEETAKSEQAVREEEYAKTMVKHQFGPASFATHKYMSTKHTPNRQLMKRIRIELDTIRSSAPLHYESSVMVRFDPANLTLMKAMITGPHDTPYDSGVYLFDILVPSGFPNGPPKVLMMNTGGDRFNPNLYNCGKVCLSLLGTWRGDKGESWNADVSTISQVFTSIQGLILIHNPYFNEPSYESSIGTAHGEAQSKSYNAQRRWMTMKTSYLATLKNPAPEFADAIRDHFRLKRDHIKLVMQKWIDEDSGSYRSQMQGFQKEMVGLLDAL